MDNVLDMQDSLYCQTLRAMDLAIRKVMIHGVVKTNQPAIGMATEAATTHEIKTIIDTLKQLQEQRRAQGK